MARKKRTPWQKIRDADERATGLRLTPDEVGRLARDGAIIRRAELDDENDKGVPDDEAYPSAGY